MKRKVKSRRNETLNPRWLESRISFPAKIFFVLLFLLLEYFNQGYALYDLPRGGYIIGTLILGTVGSHSWCITVILIDYSRRRKARYWRE